MNDAESRFWTDLAQQLNPGWTIGMGSDGALIGTMLATHDTCLYLVDTSTPWIAAGSTTSAELLRLKRELAKAKLAPGTVPGAAGAAILECGKRQLRTDHPDAVMAFTAAAGAVTEAATWTAVMDRMGSPAGHWTWLVYRLKNGDPLGRPLFGHSGDKRGFMSIGNLKESIAAALTNDIANPASAVARQISAGGGVEFCQEMFEWFPEPLANIAGRLGERSGVRPPGDAK
jgi:hypothetical protein